MKFYLISAVFVKEDSVQLELYLVCFEKWSTLRFDPDSILVFNEWNVVRFVLILVLILRAKEEVLFLCFALSVGLYECCSAETWKNSSLHWDPLTGKV